MPHKLLLPSALLQGAICFACGCGVESPTPHNIKRTNRLKPNSSLESKAANVLRDRASLFESELKRWEKAKQQLDVNSNQKAQLLDEMKSNSVSRPLAPVHAFRTWSTDDVKFSTTAILVETDNVSVKLRKKDGKHVTIRKARLFAGDRIYVEDAFDEHLAYRDALAAWKISGIENDSLKIKIKVLDEQLRLARSKRPVKPTLDQIKEELRQDENAKQSMLRDATARQEKENEALRQRQNQEHLDRFRRVLPSNPVARSPFMDNDTLVVSVGNSWHYQPYQIRLQSAQNLFVEWRNIRSRGGNGQLRMRLEDLNGNRIGGYDAWNGVWVTEKE